MSFNIRFIMGCTIGYVLFIILFLFYKKEMYQQPMLNIYNEPLKSCGSKTMNNGSWDNDKKCSELNGGVHQICIKNISKNTKEFSKKTGQSDWSDQRGKDNHCVCLGAWSLYNTQNTTDKVLKCDSIPKASFSTEYVSKFSEGWNKWNGLEIKDQIKNGVESLFRNCYDPQNKTQSENLRSNYCDFAKKNRVLKNSKLYKNIC